MQRNIFPRARFRLDPIDKSFLRLLQKQFQILFHFLTAIDEPLIFHLLVFVFGFFRQAAEFQAELTERLAELEKFQKLTVGRELKMVELKKEIEELRREIAVLKSESGQGA